MSPASVIGFLNRKINGGVVVFLRAIRERWLQMVRQRFSLLANVLEGDQDLIMRHAPRPVQPATCLARLHAKVTMRVSPTAGMVLAAYPQLPRFALPATYNYAFLSAAG